jgi:ABC-type glycerol-3-phosphate transport system substrate-binding protein
MIEEIVYLHYKGIKPLGILIISAFLMFSSSSCDFNSNKNLLTFYYHSEDSQKKELIKKLINKFENATNIEIELKEYFSDDIQKILNQTNSKFDVIDLNYSNLSDFPLEKQLINFDSLPKEITPKYNHENYLIPWISDYYLLFYNKSFVNGNPKMSIPVKSIEELIYFSALVDNDGIRGFGMIVNNSRNTLNNLLCFLQWNGGNLNITSDSINFNSIELIETIEHYQLLSKYSYFGTQKEIESEFLNNKIGFCIGNTSLTKRVKKLNPEINFQCLKKKNNNENIGFFKSFLAISKKSYKINNAVRFINFLTADSNMIIIEQHTLLDNDSDNLKKSNLKSSDNRQIFQNNQITYEIDKALTSIVLGQDSIYNVIEKTNRKINSLIKQKKHFKHR